MESFVKLASRVIGSNMTDLARILPVDFGVAVGKIFRSG